MPVRFQNDTLANDKYMDAYFRSQYGNTVWFHGDYVMINPVTQGVVM